MKKVQIDFNRMSMAEIAMLNALIQRGVIVEDNGRPKEIRIAQEQPARPAERGGDAYVAKRQPGWQSMSTKVEKRVDKALTLIMDRKRGILSTTLWKKLGVTGNNATHMRSVLKAHPMIGHQVKRKNSMLFFPKDGENLKEGDSLKGRGTRRIDWVAKAVEFLRGKESSFRFADLKRKLNIPDGQTSQVVRKMLQTHPEVETCNIQGKFISFQYRNGAEPKAKEAKHEKPMGGGHRNPYTKFVGERTKYHMKAGLPYMEANRIAISEWIPYGQSHPQIAPEATESPEIGVIVQFPAFDTVSDELAPILVGIAYNCIQGMKIAYNNVSYSLDLQSNGDYRRFCEEFIRKSDQIKRHFRAVGSFHFDGSSISFR